MKTDGAAIANSDIITEEKRTALKEKARKFISEPGIVQTGIDGFSISMRTRPTFNQHCFYKPMAIVILQGKKKTVLGSEHFTYNENQIVVTAIDIPTVGSVIEASEDKPFMTLILDLDSYLISRLLNEDAGQKNGTSSRAMEIMDGGADILDAFYRLLLLVEQPERQKVMVPMILKEIHYLLLTSPLGDILRTVNTKGSQNNQIANAVAWLKENYCAPLKVDELAQKFNMAESSFYRHFSKVTSLSPLQYQKQLRLYEAQRLMLAEDFDAAAAAYEVGYESVSQFTREYKRMFGTPPRTNISRLKQEQDDGGASKHNATV